MTNQNRLFFYSFSFPCLGKQNFFFFGLRSIACSLCVGPCNQSTKSYTFYWMSYICILHMWILYIYVWLELNHWSLQIWRLYKITSSYFRTLSILGHFYTQDTTDNGMDEGFVYSFSEKQNISKHFGKLTFW